MKKNLKDKDSDNGFYVNMYICKYCHKKGNEDPDCSHCGKKMCVILKQVFVKSK